jgi:hypothetical protein
MEWQTFNTSFVVYGRSSEAPHGHRDFSSVDPDARRDAVLSLGQVLTAGVLEYL